VVAVMAVAAEVAGPQVQLYVALEGTPGGDDDGIAEVRAGAAPAQAAVDHLQRLAANQGQSLGRETLALPEVSEIALG
jgi:hypothetical protein